MAWNWETEPSGTLRTQFNGIDGNKNFAGVNVSVLEQSADYAVEQLNKILDIGGTTAIANEASKFTETAGVTYDE